MIYEEIINQIDMKKTYKKSINLIHLKKYLYLSLYIINLILLSFFFIFINYAHKQINLN